MRSNSTAPTSELRPSGRELAVVVSELILAWIVIWEFGIEERRGLSMAMAVVIPGFVVHSFLPLRLRTGWFLILSVACLFYVLPPVQGLSLLGIGFALMLLARLPIRLRYRVMLLAVATTGLVLWRSRSQEAFWPILGSMFMFRMILYLFDSRRVSADGEFLPTASYFFMLPNAFFALFPVVDYRTFRTTYYNRPAAEILQSGARWIAAGLVHLLLYRIIKTYLHASPLEIHTAVEVAVFLATNYALYLRVSGQFHIICGMLHLFGWNLPRTHDCYFLASSFSDIWRRINIYWKDFLMKVAFFPAFFRLRALGSLPGVALAVLWVFLCTWIAHSWQVFWLLGDFPLRGRDAVLWLGVGVLVAGSSVLDYRRAAEGPATRTGFRWTTALTRMLKIVGVFSSVSLFWGWWSNREIMRFLFFGNSGLTFTRHDALVLGGAVTAIVVIGSCWQWSVSAARSKQGKRSSAGPNRQEVNFERSAAWNLLTLVGLALLGIPGAGNWIGPGTADFLTNLRENPATAQEAFGLVDGYYEQLNAGSSQALPYLRDSRSQEESQRGESFSAMTRQRRDLLEFELIPGWKGSFNDVPLSVNRWGMRDQNRRLERTDQTYRIAVVGSSAVMGYGVSDDDTFTRGLERILNDRLGQSPRQFEVLNFGVGRYFAVHKRLQIERKVLRFRPDLILYFAHQDELYSTPRWLAEAIYRGVDLDDECLQSVVRDAGITAGMSEGQIQTILQSQLVPVLDCTYARMEDVCRQHGIKLLWVDVPMPGVADLPFDPKIPARRAEATGIEVIDLTGWTGDRAAREILMGSHDHHPNALGHQLLAEALWHALKDRPELMGNP